MSETSAQVSGTYSIMVGEIKVTSILESYIPAPDGLMTNASREQLVARQLESLRGDVPFVSISCFLVETGASRILVDTGLGGGPNAQQGRLVKELAGLGLKPADIDRALFTHLHTDHFGGLFSENGECVFTSATFVAHKLERTFCFEQETIDGCEPVVFQFEAAQRLRPLLDRFVWLGEEEVVPGIQLVHLPGHTPGHSGFRVESGGHSLLLWGDIVHQPQHQFDDPKIGVSFDVDPEKARETRERVMSDVVRTKELVAGTHTDFPCFGRVKSKGDGFQFVPLVWASAVAAAAPVGATSAL